MKENSIEETKKQLELILKVRKEQKEIIECAGGSCMNCDPDIKALSKSIEILSDYKRVLKENEELKKDRKNNNEMIALAQNEILNYMSAYEEGKKHKMTAVAQVVENQQYYIVQKQMEKYEEHIKRLQKENEELKETYKSEKKMKNEYVKLYQDLLLKENVITVQKIKDKIEEYKNMLKTCNKVKDIDRIKAINERILELEELLEGRE